MVNDLDKLNLERLAAHRHAQAERMQHATTVRPVPKSRRLVALAVVAVVIATVVVVAERADAANGNGYADCKQIVAPYPYEACQSMLGSSWGTAYYNVGSIYAGLPKLVVGVQWGYGFACARVATVVATGSVPWALYGINTSQGCTGPYGISVVDAIAVIFPPGSAPQPMRFTLYVLANGTFVWNYSGPHPIPCGYQHCWGAG